MKQLLLTQAMVCKQFEELESLTFGNQFIVHEFISKDGGGFGNQLCRLWHAFEIALLLQRKLWIFTDDAPIAAFLESPDLPNIVKWTNNPPEAMEYVNYRMTAGDRLKTFNLLNATKYISLKNLPNSFPSYTKIVYNQFSTLLPCFAFHVIKPIAMINDAITNTSGAQPIVAIHARTSDGDMVKRMTGTDDWHVFLTQVIHARRANLAFGQKPSCDKDALNLELMSTCAASHMSPRTVLFESSDSSDVDLWFRERFPAIIQTPGIPVHTARKIHASQQNNIAKVLIDFILLTRADVLITNCVRGSTWEANVKLIRDSQDILTYRSYDCNILEPFPYYLGGELVEYGLTWNLPKDVWLTLLAMTVLATIAIKYFKQMYASAVTGISTGQKWYGRIPMENPQIM